MSAGMGVPSRQSGPGFPLLFLLTFSPALQWQLCCIMVVSGSCGPKQAGPASAPAPALPGYASWVRAPLFSSLSYLIHLTGVTGPGEDRRVMQVKVLAQCLA